MTPAARVQAAIEILDLVIDAARHQGAPADRIVSDWFRTRRFAGSKDRRAVRELVYRAIRACGDVPESGRAAILRLAQDDPFLRSFDDMSLFCHGDGAFLKPDGEGRIMVTDFIREHTGITDAVAFVGRGHFFQMWEPERFRAFREEVRARLRAMREAQG